MDPQIEWRKPDGVPSDLHALWEDPTLRDLDAATVLSVRQQVVRRLANGGPSPSSGPGLGEAVLGAAAVGLGVVAIRSRRGGGRRR